MTQESSPIEERQEQSPERRGRTVMLDGDIGEVRLDLSRERKVRISGKRGDGKIVLRHLLITRNQRVQII